MDDQGDIGACLGHDPCADVVLYCLRGVRSAGVADALVARGYRRVRVLEGGVTPWEAAGYPVVP
jgi:rhodanese-related sulfurtransferase